MPNLSDRIARRLQDGREYHAEFMADLENGRRNMFGFRNHRWYEHEEELRRKRHEERRKRHHRRHHEDKHNGDGREYSKMRSAGGGHDHSGDGDRGHDRSSHHGHKDEGKSYSVDASHKNKSHRREHRGDIDKNRHPAHHDSSKGLQASKGGNGRRNEHSKDLQKTQEARGGATQQPMAHHIDHDQRHHRSRIHRSRTPERVPDEYGQPQDGTVRPPQPKTQGYDDEYPPAFPQQYQKPYGMYPQYSSPSQHPSVGREDRYQPRAANGAPSETIGSRYGTPSGRTQSHGEAEDYYGGHPLRNQKAFDPPSYGPPSHQKRESRLGNLRGQPSYQRNDPSGDDEGLYGNGSEPPLRDKRSRMPKISTSSMHPEVLPGPPSTSLARDFERPFGAAKSPRNTAASACAEGAFDRDGEADFSSITSRQSSMETEHPASGLREHSENPKFDGGREHHEGIDDADYAHSELAEMHVRGGAGGDMEDEDPNALYDEYEEFDDEYGESYDSCVPDDDDYTARDRQGRYSSLSYVNAKLESERLDSFSYNDLEPRSRRYSSLSYVDAKARATGIGHMSYASSESVEEIHVPPLHGSAKAKRSGFQDAPLGKIPRTFDASSDNISEHSPRTQPYESRNKLGFQEHANDHRYSREPESSRAGSKHVKFQERSETPPPKPERPPPRPRNPSKSRSQGQQRYRVPEPTEDPPPDHYATLGISTPTTVESIATIAKKMRIKIHPDMLKRKNPDMTDQEKTAIDEHAKKVGEAAEVLLDSSICKEYHQNIRNWEAKHGKLSWARALKI